MSTGSPASTTRTQEERCERKDYLRVQHLNLNINILVNFFKKFKWIVFQHKYEHVFRIFKNNIWHFKTEELLFNLKTKCRDCTKPNYTKNFMLTPPGFCSLLFCLFPTGIFQKKLKEMFYFSPPRRRLTRVPQTINKDTILAVINDTGPLFIYFF